MSSPSSRTAQQEAEYTVGTLAAVVVKNREK
jgi:hypothetical protein